MRYLTIYTLGMLTLGSCNDSQNNDFQKTQRTLKVIPYTTYDRYYGIGTINCGPLGGVYNSSTKSYSYRIFRIQLINDTICPVELNISFPGKPIALYPDTNQSLRVFLFPDELTPDTIQDVFSFGIRGLESFLDTGLNKPTSLTRLIQPKGEHILYIGFITDGLARAKLFINGQSPGLSFLPVKSVVTDSKDKNSLDLLFDIRINNPQNYSLIHCGQIVFKK